MWCEGRNGARAPWRDCGVASESLAVPPSLSVASLRWPVAVGDALPIFTIRSSGSVGMPVLPSPFVNLANVLIRRWAS